MRLGIVLLLITAIVISGTVSCNAKVLGGPSVPSEAGIVFLDVGKGWQSEDEFPWSKCPFPWSLMKGLIFGTAEDNERFMEEREWVENQVFTINTTTIKVGYRMSSADKTMPSTVVSAFGDTVIIPVYRLDDEYIGWNYTKVIEGPTVDRSDYQGKFIVYQEFTVPPNPANMYIFMLQKHRFLFRVG